MKNRENRKIVARDRKNARRACKNIDRNSAPLQKIWTQVALSRKYELRRGIKGVIEGTLPVGGLSSSAAVILTYLNAVCIYNDIQIKRP